MGFFSGKCEPDAADNQWSSYCPSVPVAFLFFVLFSVSFVFHCFQALRHRQLFCLVMITGVLWEVAAFASRVYSAKSPTQKGVFDTSYLLLILAPVCVNAFDYMVVSRLVRRFLFRQRVCGLSGRVMGKLFVCCDIVSFIVQIGGGLMTLSSKSSTEKTGLHILTFGVVFQQALIVFFFVVTVVCGRKTAYTVRNSQTIQAGIQKTLHVVQGSLILISYRIIYRIVEFSSGEGSSLNSYIDNHEWCVYVFDAGPMFLAVLLMNIWHPGAVLKKSKDYYDDSVPVAEMEHQPLATTPSPYEHEELQVR
ncbi:hypothetical protein ASPZODRAFT_137481 [Penicilliopsis zonata CBS 506.65]|uniref:RTA1 domain protein n=1 Tax=Penicilliopsis zonata CBS 506.65 TaxID=1073090 RepID=A0A1L9S4Q6_9EURO|nr:hypothetical protein ASPZODRAFT_137481 [Penicilliopsis zonata CBS 506.65]OJJ42136.1 hypothetical protein ASPZODRAFT_137481 [Penicilliopsis zonata CBS 506.65]